MEHLNESIQKALNEGDWYREFQGNVAKLTKMSKSNINKIAGEIGVLNKKGFIDFVSHAKIVLDRWANNSEFAKFKSFDQMFDAYGNDLRDLVAREGFGTAYDNLNYQDEFWDKFWPTIK